MPWQHCNNYFNTPNCISIDDIRLLCGGRGAAKGNPKVTTLNFITANLQNPYLPSIDAETRIKKSAHNSTFTTSSSLSLSDDQSYYNHNHHHYDRNDDHNNNNNYDDRCIKLFNRTSPTEEFFKQVLFKT